MPGMFPTTDTAANFQLKTYAIELIALPRKLHTAQGQRDPDRQSQSPSMHAKSSIFQSPRYNQQQQRKETHARNPSVFPFSPSSASKTTAHSHAAHSAALEPVDFDPFESSESFGILIQDPVVSAAQRQDPANLHVFRQWLSADFPKVLKTLQSLKLLHDRSRHDQHHNTRHGGDGDHTNHVTTTSSDSRAWVNDVDGHPDSDDESGSDLDEQHQHSGSTARSSTKLAMRAANLEAWQTLFQHTTLQVLAPNDHLVVQDATRTGSVYFVLNGSCELKFQPNFLDFLLAKRTKSAATTTAHAQQSESSQSPPRPGATNKKMSKNKMRKVQAPTSSPGPSHSLRKSALGPRKLSLSHLTDQDVQEVLEKGIHLKTLRTGGFFGLDVAMFQFQTHTVSAISNGALQRSDIGLTTRSCMHVLRLPFTIFQRIRDSISISVMARSHSAQDAANIQVPRSPAPFFPYTFSQEKVDFLRQTFLFQSMHEANLQFLASQMSCIRVPRHEYLFTPGEQVAALFLVKSGQLKLSTSYQTRCVNTAVSDDTGELRDDRLGSELLASTPKVTVETRHVELEILQPHDAIGLMEVCLMRAQFASQCIAMSDDTEVYALSAFAVFSVLSCEQTASSHVVESFTRHHAWYKVRQYAALNHHQSSTTSQKESSKLSLAVQQRGPIQCSRCGWAGHVSTSSICMRAESPRTILTRQVSIISTGGNTGAGGAKPVVPVPMSPVVQLPLKTRSSRTQQRLSSLVVAKPQEELEPCNNSGPPIIVEPITGSTKPQEETSSILRPPAKTALVHSNAIVHADSQLKTSLLRGLLPFLCMKKTGSEILASSSVEEEKHKVNTASELERALKRLDKALVDENKSTEFDDGSPPERPKPIAYFSPQTRPHTEGGFRKRGNGGGDDHRANLRAAAAQAVKRISTAVAVMEANGLFEDWSTQPASSRSPRSSSKAYSHQALSLKKPDNHKAQRRNAANM